MLITAIVPCYNVEAYVQDAVQSLLDQQNSALEIILVDNGSRDTTLSKLFELREQWPDKIKVLIEKKPGAPAARNLGLKHARGQWIQFLDADDLLLPTKIHSQSLMVSKHPQVKVVLGAYWHRQLDGSAHLITPDLSDFHTSLFMGRLSITSAMLIERESLVLAGGWNETLSSGQDYDLLFRLKQLHVVMQTDTKPLTVVRKRTHGQISFTDWETVAANLVSQRQKWSKWLQEKEPSWYSVHEAFIIDCMYDAIHAVGTRNPAKAVEYYRALLPRHYLPVPNEQTKIGVWHALFVRLLGFSSFIRIRWLVGTALRPIIHYFRNERMKKKSIKRFDGE